MFTPPELGEMLTRRFGGSASENEAIAKDILTGVGNDPRLVNDVVDHLPEIVQTAYGEAGLHAKPQDLAAVMNSIMNRYAVAQNGNPIYGKSLPQILAAYDANGIGHQYGRGEAL